MKAVHSVLSTLIEEIGEKSAVELFYCLATLFLAFSNRHHNLSPRYYNTGYTKYIFVIFKVCNQTIGRVRKYSNAGYSSMGGALSCHNVIHADSIFMFTTLYGVGKKNIKNEMTVN